MHRHIVPALAVLLLAGLPPPTVFAQQQPPRPAQPPAAPPGGKPQMAPGPSGPMSPGPGAQMKPPAPAPVKPYKAVAITPAQPMKDPAFEAFRKQLADAAQKKDRAALGKLVVAQGYFWDRENGDGADKKKSGIDNFSATLGLSGKDGVGWDMLAGYASDPTASESPDHKGAFCAPADPGFSDAELEELIKSTQTDLPDWGYTLTNGVEVRDKPQANAQVIEKLGMHFIRLMIDANPNATMSSFVRVATPSGKTGFVRADAVAPLGNDQICYVKEADGWKIGGYMGGGEAQ